MEKKKIIMPIYNKKVYLVYDNQFIELGKGNIETLTTMEEETSDTIEVPEMTYTPASGILTCEAEITLRTFIGFHNNIYVKLHGATLIVPTKDLMWGPDGEAACYTWRELGESSTFTWYNYMKDWAFTMEGFGEQK